MKQLPFKNFEFKYIFFVYQTPKKNKEYFYSLKKSVLSLSIW